MRDLTYVSTGLRYGRLAMAVIYGVLVIFTVIALTPFSWTLLNSVKTNDEILSAPFSLPQKFLWKNYTEAWTTGSLGVYFWNSVASAIPVVVVSIAISSLAGYVFARVAFWAAACCCSSSLRSHGPFQAR